MANELAIENFVDFSENFIRQQNLLPKENFDLPEMDQNFVKEVLEELEKSSTNDSNDLKQLEQSCNDIFYSDMEDENKAKILEKFLVQTCKQKICQSPMLLFYVAWTFHQFDQHKLVVKLCQEYEFPNYLHKIMQLLWDDSQEILEKIKKKKFQMNSVQRFRLRKKHPYPANIWNGDQIKYGLSTAGKQTLVDFYDNVSKKPTRKEKEILAKKIGISLRVGSFLVLFNK